MAYVESFYLDVKLETEPSDQSDEAKVLEESVADRPLDDVAICRIVASQQTVCVEKPEPPSSDYCGFESDEIPPVYRAQLRQIQKAKLKAAAEKEKSVYAYQVDTQIEATPVKVFKNSNVSSAECYVPGFSPPQHNDEVHKRTDFSLPRGHSIAATENVFNISGGRNEPASHYVLLPHEEEQLLSAQKKSELQSLISYTASECTNESSTITAALGPAWGCISPAPHSHRSSPAKQNRPEDKYKGLSAFRPVSQSIESQYAFPDLN